jgi:hypothetical protein
VAVSILAEFAGSEVEFKRAEANSVWLDVFHELKPLRKFLINLCGRVYYYFEKRSRCP